MRNRLIFSFILVVIVAVGGVVLIARQGAASEVRSFMVRGGMVRLDFLVNELEDYYHNHQTWDGAQALLKTFYLSPGEIRGNKPEHAGPGMMGGEMAEMMAKFPSALI